MRRGKIRGNEIANQPFSKLLDVVDEIASLTATLPDKSSLSAKSHCASMPMGGGQGECKWINCRVQRIDELARFTALYSDRVFFHNFLADIAPSFGHPPDADDEEFRFDLATDLTVLAHARPLIEAGILVPYSTPRTYCPSCFAEQSVGEQASRRVSKALRLLSRELLNNLSVEIHSTEFGYIAVCAGPKGIFGDKQIVFDLKRLRDELRNKPRLMAQLNSGSAVVASKELRRKLGLHAGCALDVLNSTTYQMAVAELTGASFLTHREVDLDVLSFIAGDSELERKNALLSQHLRAIVPFAGDVPVKDLVRLRKRESDAFVRFRAALDKALDEATSEGKALSERTAREVYSDVIAPEVSRLEQKVREAKRDLVKTPLSSTAATIAVIGLGLYSGMVPAEFATIAKALGLTKVTYDTVSTSAKLIDVRQTIRQERFYFLWRVRHAARKRLHKHAIY